MCEGINWSGYCRKRLSNLAEKSAMRESILDHQRRTLMIIFHCLGESHAPLPRGLENVWRTSPNWREIDIESLHTPGPGYACDDCWDEDDAIDTLDSQIASPYSSRDYVMSCASSRNTSGGESYAIQCIDMVLLNGDGENRGRARMGFAGRVWERRRTTGENSHWMAGKTR